jgi:hypothetical protein
MFVSLTHVFAVAQNADAPTPDPRKSTSIVRGQTSDWFGVVYREVLAQGALLHEAESHGGGAAPGTTTHPKAAGSSTPRHRAPATRTSYTESINDAQRVVCSEAEGGDCE